MALLPSGSLNNVTLLEIETDELQIYIEGKPQPHHLKATTSEVQMHFSTSDVAAKVKLFQYGSNEMEGLESAERAPLFFENGFYEVLIVPKNEEVYSFYHEYYEFRDAVKSHKAMKNVLRGTLHFRNEVGLSTLEIHRDGKHVLDFTIEVFPTKLDYVRDYQSLLNEITDELHNLAYSFIQRTHLKASAKIFKDPSPTEFYRLIQQHFEEYEKAISQIERMPHHQLNKTYEVVRGEKLRKQDSMTRNYLRKNANRFAEVERGIQISGKSYLPTKGLFLKKEHTVDTNENRYIKWTMTRISAKVDELLKRYEAWCRGQNRAPDGTIATVLKEMSGSLHTHLRKPLWQQVGKLDRNVHSLVLQMAAGYKEASKVYATVFQSLALYGDIYKLSLKNIATLYEYWTFIKLGQILRLKCDLMEQNVVRHKNGGMYVLLEQGQSSEFKYKHRVTGEEILLQYQYRASELPTVDQEPDSMLSIGKRGKDYLFHYVFDAKYKVEFSGDQLAGPKNEDINTMHRYRDSIVVEHNGSYERTAYGAYVLFPWKDDPNYKKHKFYKSIDKVNIGGLPFLPNNTALVEQVIDNLLNKTGDELQREGILPRGTLLYQEEQSVLIVNELTVAKDELPLKWHLAKEIALVHDGVVTEIAAIEGVQETLTHAEFSIGMTRKLWYKLVVSPFMLRGGVLVDQQSLLQARSISEALVKPGIEWTLWQALKQRFEEVKVLVNGEVLDADCSIRGFEIYGEQFVVVNGSLICGEQQMELSEPSYLVVDWVTELLEAK